jgi:hypothetical protein
VAQKREKEREEGKGKGGVKGRSEREGERAE